MTVFYRIDLERWPAVSKVRAALLEIINNWNGGRYGAAKALAKKIAPEQCEELQKRINRELGGTRPSWELVLWTVQHCAPPDHEVGWHDEQLSRLAGLWHDDREEFPPGYAGRVIHGDGRVLRDAIASSTEATDPLARAILLEKERDAAHEQIRTYEAQRSELETAMNGLRADLEELRQERNLHKDAFVEDVTTLAAQLRMMTRRAEEANELRARLDREKEALDIRLAQLLQERDEARVLADLRYREIEEVRREADVAQQRLRAEILTLEKEISGLRSVVNSMRTSDDPQTSPIGQQEILGLLAEIS